MCAAISASSSIWSRLSAQGRRINSSTPHVGLALDRLLQRGAITGLRLVRIGSFNQATAVASSANLFAGEIER
jgi:hypothetical protein